MLKRHGLFALAIAAAFLAPAPAFAQNTVFFTSKGDITFPFKPPGTGSNAGVAGTINNMSIGQTTPKPGSFTTLTSTLPPSGAGITALFASPPAIGGTAPSAGTFTTLRTTGTNFVNQGTPAAATVSATLTAANLLTKIVTVNQGGAAASAQQLPLATAMDTALPTAVAGDSFDFSVINISTVAAESASLTTNTGWTLVGDMDILANSAATTKSAGRFRATKTGTGAWTLYRLS